MTKAARIVSFLIAIVVGPAEWSSACSRHLRRRWAVTFGLLALFVLAVPHRLAAQADCLACHGDKTMQDAAGHSIAVDGDKFSASMHGSLQCNNCHADIKQYPHPDQIAKVDCKTCHADEASKLTGSVHSSSKEHPCTSCHGNAHEIFPKTDARSAVYPLNVPKTCGQCHSDGAMASKKGLASVYTHYMDSIHGFALSKEGLLVAANCQSCHGSHGILSHNDPSQSDLQGEHPQDLRHLPRQNQRRLPGRRPRPRCGFGQTEGPCLHRLPHRAHHPAADRIRIPHAVHADLRLLPQGKALHLSRYVSLAARFARRLRGNGALLGLPRCTRDLSRIGSALARQQSQPGKDVRSLPQPAQT